MVFICECVTLCVCVLVFLTCVFCVIITFSEGISDVCVLCDNNFF